MARSGVKCSEAVGAATEPSLPAAASDELPAAPEDDWPTLAEAEARLFVEQLEEEAIEPGAARSALLRTMYGLTNTADSLVQRPGAAARRALANVEFVEAVFKLRPDLRLVPREPGDEPVAGVQFAESSGWQPIPAPLHLGDEAAGVSGCQSALGAVTSPTGSGLTAAYGASCPPPADGAAAEPSRASSTES